VKNGLWTSDFILEDGIVLVKKTGHRFVFDMQLWQEIFSWSLYYAGLELHRLRHAFARPRGAIAFLPDAPRPWYMIWGVAACAGLRIVKDPRQADIVMHFDDSTTCAAIGLPDFGNRPPHLINLDCRDISKSEVARAFDAVAGYSLSVDPAAHEGLVVDKSEINAAHDGRIVQAPFPPQPGRAYQRLIDNEIEGGLVEDLRTVTANGEAVAVFRKRRQVARRFTNYNASCDWASPRDCFSDAEIDLIRRFTRELKLDWGSVDVLRNNADGRIYIVDANKTDMGPPVILALGQRLRAIRHIARAFVAQFAPGAPS
jgi:hypothetical protein